MWIDVGLFKRVRRGRGGKGVRHKLTFMLHAPPQNGIADLYRSYPQTPPVVQLQVVTPPSRDIVRLCDAQYSIDAEVAPACNAKAWRSGDIVHLKAYTFDPVLHHLFIHTTDEAKFISHAMATPIPTVLQRYPPLSESTIASLREVGDPTHPSPSSIWTQAPPVRVVFGAGPPANRLMTRVQKPHELVPTGRPAPLRLITEVVAKHGPFSTKKGGLLVKVECGPHASCKVVAIAFSSIAVMQLQSMQPGDTVEVYDPNARVRHAPDVGASLGAGAGAQGGNAGGIEVVVSDAVQVQVLSRATSSNENDSHSTAAFDEPLASKLVAITELPSGSSVRAIFGVVARVLPTETLHRKTDGAPFEKSALVLVDGSTASPVFAVFLGAAWKEALRAVQAGDIVLLRDARVERFQGGPAQLTVPFRGSSIVVPPGREPDHLVRMLHPPPETFGTDPVLATVARFADVGVTISFDAESYYPACPRNAAHTQRIEPMSKATETTQVTVQDNVTAMQDGDALGKRDRSDGDAEDMWSCRRCARTFPGPPRFAWSLKVLLAVHAQTDGSTGPSVLDPCVAFDPVATHLVGMSADAFRALSSEAQSAAKHQVSQAQFNAAVVLFENRNASTPKTTCAVPTTVVPAQYTLVRVEK